MFWIQRRFLKSFTISIYHLAISLFGCRVLILFQRETLLASYFFAIIVEYKTIWHFLINDNRNTSTLNGEQNRVVVSNRDSSQNSIFKMTNSLQTIFHIIFLMKTCTLIQISLKFVPMGTTDNMVALVQIMACRKTDYHLNKWLPNLQTHIDGLVQDCSNSIANPLELLQSCTKPLIYKHHSASIHWVLVMHTSIIDWSSLVQVMACCLFSSKSLPKTIGTIEISS